MPELVSAGNDEESGGASPARSSASEESWDTGAGGPLDGAALRRLAAERANLMHTPTQLTPARAMPNALCDDIDGIPGAYYLYVTVPSAPI